MSQDKTCLVCGKKIYKLFIGITLAHDAPDPEVFTNGIQARHPWYGKKILEVRKSKYQPYVSSGNWTKRNIDVWFGEYKGYGFDNQFHSLRCCEKFANACIRAGFVMKKGS